MLANTKTANRSLQLVACVSAVLIWQLALTWTPSEIVPSPFSCLLALWQMLSNGSLVRDLQASISRVIAGFAFAAVAGIGIGMFAGLVPPFEKTVLPLFEVLRPIPPIAWIPLAVVLFGLGSPSAYFVIFLGAFFPILTNTLLGVQEIPTAYLEAGHSLGIPKWSRYKDIVWPAALTSIFAGMRIGLGFAWMCVIAAEMIAASSGLGYSIQLYRQTLRLDRVVPEMIAIGLIGALMTKAMDGLSWICLPWRRSNSRQRLVIPKRAKRLFTSAIHQIDDSTPSILSQPAGSLEVSNITFAYSSNPELIIRDLSFMIRPGEVLAILGPSGSGKSTLLRLLAGLEEPAKGFITVESGLHAERTRAMTMVFQSGAVFPWKTALDNIAMGALTHPRSRAERATISRSLLALVGLSEKAGSYPHELSGGQQQRVAVARALANQPRVLLLDEPFASLDSQTREHLQNDVSCLLNSQRMTAVIVTHDITEAIYMADRIVIMSTKGGQFVHETIITTPRPRPPEWRNSHEANNLRLKLWQILCTTGEGTHAHKKEIAQWT